MVSSAVAVPVVKSVDDTLAVHVPSSVPRLSVTDVDPSCAEVVAVPVPTDPSDALAGALMLSAPAVNVKVVVVSAANAGPPIIAIATAATVIPINLLRIFPTPQSVGARRTRTGPVALRPGLTTGLPFPSAAPAWCSHPVDHPCGLVI